MVVEILVKKYNFSSVFCMFKTFLLSIVRSGRRRAIGGEQAYDDNDALLTEEEYG